MIRASIRQVAERAQVSRMTVTRVLQGRKDLVNERTYNRVLEVMHDLEYVPVRPAMQNRHIKTNVIGMVPHYRNPSRSVLDTRTFEGLCDQAARNSYDLFVMLRGEAEWMVNREELRFLDRRTDGFIFISPGLGEWHNALAALVRHEIPVVVCYRREVPPGVAWVDPDNEAIIDLAVDYLVQRGHTQIGYCSGPMAGADDEDLLANLSGNRVHSDNACRTQRFLRRMAALGCAEPAKQIVRIPTNWQFKKEDIQKLFTAGITALISSDVLALQVSDLLAEMGKSVPEDLSIINIGDETGAVRHQFTGVEFGYDAVGRTAIQAWLERQDGRPASECSRIVPVKLVERASVGPPRRS